MQVVLSSTELISSSLFVSMHSNRNFNTSLDCWLVGKTVGEGVSSSVVAINFSTKELPWSSVSGLGEHSLKHVAAPILSSNPVNEGLGHGGDWRCCGCQMVATLLLLWPGSEDAMVEKLLLLSLIYLETVGPTPSCGMLVSLEAVGLEERADPLLETVRLDKRCDGELDMDSGLGLRVVLQPSSE